MAELEKLKKGHKVRIRTTGRAPTEHDGKITGFTEKQPHRGGAVRVIVKITDGRELKVLPGQVTPT